MRLVADQAGRGQDTAGLWAVGWSFAQCQAGGSPHLPSLVCPKSGTGRPPLWQPRVLRAGPRVRDLSKARPSGAQGAELQIKGFVCPPAALPAALSEGLSTL